MRINRYVRTLAVVAGLAAATAPAAYASDIGDGGGGGGLPATPRAQVTTTHRDSGTTDWALIALGTGGAVVLVGAGVGGSRAHSRRTSAREGEPARVS